MLTDLLNILLVEDNEDDYVIVRDLLRDIDPDRYVLDWEETYESGLAAIRARRQDLILLDFRLMGRTGLEFLEETRSVSPRVPVILMTGQGDHDIDMQAMQAGATDYLVKDRLDADQLERAIRYAVERQKSAAALRASEDRYRTFVENSTEGIWRFELEQPLPTDLAEDEQRAFLHQYAFLAECNDTMARLQGFQRAAEILGRRLRDFFPLEKASSTDFLGSLIRSGYRLTRTEAFEIDGQGQPKYVLHHLIGVIEDGVLLRIWGSQTDNTDHKRGELAQSQLAAIVESSDDAIFSKTLDGLIVTWNKSAEALYGYTAQEVIGQSVSLLIPFEQPEQLNYIMERVRHGERISQFETVRRHKDGRLVDVSLTVSPIIDAAGQVTGASTIVRDISEQKRLAGDLAAAAAKNERIAETLQRSMLKETPAGKFPGIAVETLYQVALEEARVGGDFCDAFALSGGKVALVVGDVSGKGLAAAGRTAEVKYALRAFLHAHSAPDMALIHLNDFIYETHHLDTDNRGVFIVLAVAVVDPVTGEAVFSAAGAEPSLILRAGGAAEPVEITGWPIGIQPDALYTAKSTWLASGETVLMATDGITEARCGHEFLGSEGMAALAEKSGPTAPLGVLSQAIYGGALDFAGGSIRDDVCLLLARRQ